MWCWVAAVGAGLVKSDEILLGATRLRVSFDIQYEEDYFSILMDEASTVSLAFSHLGTTCCNFIYLYLVCAILTRHYCK